MKSATPVWLAASLILSRAALIVLSPTRPVGPTVMLLLDGLTLMPLGLSILVGRVVGTFFGSIAVSVIGMSLALGGAGYLVDRVGGRTMGNLFGLLAMMAIAVGLCCGGGMQKDRFGRIFVRLIGIFLFGVSMKIAAETRSLAEITWLGTPYLVAAAVALPLGSRRRSAPPSSRSRPR